MAKKTAEKEAAREAAEERMAQKAAEAEAAHACGVSLATERRWELRLPRGVPVAQRPPAGQALRWGERPSMEH